jgi:hypothetical protein
MFVILHELGMFAADMFKSRRRLEAENLFLRHQLNIAFEAGAAPSPKSANRDHQRNAPVSATGSALIVMYSQLKQVPGRWPIGPILFDCAAF